MSPPASLPLTRALFQQVCKWMLDGCFSSSPSDRRAMWPWPHFLALSVPGVVIVRQLMFSDTSSCNTGHQPVIPSLPTTPRPRPPSNSLSQCLRAVIEILSTHSSSQASSACLEIYWLGSMSWSCAVWMCLKWDSTVTALFPVFIGGSCYATSQREHWPCKMMSLFCPSD